MAYSWGLRASGLSRGGLGVAVAGFGTCALTGYTWGSARGGVPTPDVSAVILTLIAIGAAAGLISGSFRVAAVSWVAAVMGSMLAYVATSTIDPGLPAQHSSFTGHELLNVAFLLPCIAGGHLLGAWVGVATWRGALGAAIAGVGTWAFYMYASWNIVDGVVRNPGIAMVLLSWSGIGVIAGLISARLRDAPASWAAAVIGFLLAYLACYGIRQGVTGPVEQLLYAPLMLLIFVAGGHALGSRATFANRALRKATA